MAFALLLCPFCKNCNCYVWLVSSTVRANSWGPVSFLDPPSPSRANARTAFPTLLLSSYYAYCLSSSPAWKFQATLCSGNLCLNKALLLLLSISLFWLFTLTFEPCLRSEPFDYDLYDAIFIDGTFTASGDESVACSVLTNFYPLIVCIIFILLLRQYIFNIFSD